MRESKGKIVPSKDGTTIAYDVFGEGPPLIFIAGAICFRQFPPIVKDAKTFATEFTVYSYDRRGRGDSTNIQPYSLERELEDIEALIDAAGGRAFLYGHSSGAVLALEAALRFPKKVAKIALFDAPYVHNDAEKYEFSVLAADVMKLVQAGKNGAALKRFLSGIGMPKVFVFLIPLMPGWGKMKALAPTLEYDLKMTSGLPPLARAAQIQVPTQVMYGGKSPKGIHDVAESLAKAIPGAKLSVLAGQDHAVSAKALLPLLSSFFQEKH